MPSAFFDKDLAETMSYWATTLAILFAIIAGVYTLWKYRIDQKLQVRNQARDAYGQFMKLALEYPEFVPGCWTRIQSDPVQKNKFEWYMAHFLWSSEDILMYDPKDKEGHLAGIRDTILEHCDYFSSESFAKKEADGYCATLRDLIENTVGEVGAGIATAAKSSPKPRNRGQATGC